MTVIPDQEQIEKAFGFDGQWVPDIDPTKIGEHNFAKLKNLRYTEEGIEPIEGYSAITSTAVNATYLYQRDAIQLRSVLGSTTSYLLVFAWNAAEDAARVYENRTSIPTAGDFQTNPIFTPGATPTDGRFGHLPRGIGFCTVAETCVYEGGETHPGVVQKIQSISGLSLTNPQDFTEEMTNSLSTTNNTMTLSGNFLTFILGTTRPIKGFKAYVKTANGTASTMAVNEWTSGAWAAVSNLSDGTSSGGKTLAQTGAVTFDTTVGSSEPSFMDNVFLYHYQVVISAGSATLSQITVDMPFQTAVDIWDGVYRTCISFNVIINNAAYSDYTLEVNEESNIDYPIAATLSAFGQHANDKLDLCFEERQTALKWEILGTKQNTTALTMAIAYWDGDSYADVGTVVDGTLDEAGGTKSLNQSGVMSWNPPAAASEIKRTKFGVTGYWYQLDPSGQLSADVRVDFLTGIPAPKIVRGHSFPAKYAGRAFFGGDTNGGEGNALDYTASNTIDVHNGLDSSDRGQRIYVGGKEKLTSARSIYNRFGSSIYETLLLFKQAETHLLFGTSPSDFRLYKISESYGCPAPRTLVSAEIGYEMAQGAFRNVVIWMSYRGPIIFDGAVVMPIPGVDLYFDPRKSTVINTGIIEKCQAFFDPFWGEYHLMIPSGSSQTTLNTHIVYDIRRKKWWEVNYDGGASDIPQLGLTVFDTDGAAHPYVMRNDGHTLRFGNGSDWDGNDLTHLVRTADMIPAGLWKLCQLTHLKLGHQVPDFIASDTDITISINAYVDGAETATALDDFTISRSDYVGDFDLFTEASETLTQEDTGDIHIEVVDQTRYVRDTQAKLLNFYSIAFEFSRTNTDTSFLGNFGKTFLWWGFLAKAVGDDVR